MKIFNAMLLPLAGVSLVLAAQTVSAQGTYPQVTRAAVADPIVRACTQLELSAGIDSEKCGTMTLAEVVNALDPGWTDD